MATLTQLIPFSELAPGQAAKIRSDLVGRLINEAAAKLSKSSDSLIVRDIRAASDIVLYSKGSAIAVEDWACVTGTTANAYETMALGTMSDVRWIGIYGVTITEICACTALKFNVGGADRVIWQLQALREDDSWTGFSPAGVVIPQNMPYTISRWVRQTSSPAFIVLKGVVVEARGTVISP